MESSRLSVIRGDGRYAGKLIDWAANFGRWVLQIAQRTKDAEGFAVSPSRWVVKRMFSWLGKYRRLSKDYGSRTHSNEGMIQPAMINLMIHRLKHS